MNVRQPAMSPLPRHMAARYRQPRARRLMFTLRQRRWLGAGLVALFAALAWTLAGKMQVREQARPGSADTANLRGVLRPNRLCPAAMVPHAAQRQSIARHELRGRAAFSIAYPDANPRGSTRPGRRQRPARQYGRAHVRARAAGTLAVNRRMAAYLAGLVLLASCAVALNLPTRWLRAVAPAKWPLTVVGVRGAIGFGASGLLECSWRFRKRI